MSLAAVALGACFIEKHFTIDKKMEGWDHKISSNPEELKKITSGSKKIFDALGSRRIHRVESIKRIEAFRRSIVAKKPLKIVSIIKSKDITFKRPGWGIEPEYVEFIINRKVKNNISKDAIIRLKDLVYFK